jgi:hypothetical protein
MQVGKRSAREHYPGSLVSDRSWKPVLFCIKGPRNRPMRSDRYSGTRLIGRIGVTPLCCSAEHVNHARRFIRRLRFALHGIHRIPIGFMHIGGSPILFSLPGTQTHSLVPLAKTVSVPSAPSSATVAFLVTCSGPESRALVIFGSCARSCICWPFVFAVRRSESVSFERTKLRPELLLNDAAVPIAAMTKSLRVPMFTP